MVIAGDGRIGFHDATTTIPYDISGIKTVNTSYGMELANTSAGSSAAVFYSLENDAATNTQMLHFGSTNTMNRGGLTDVGMGLIHNTSPNGLIINANVGPLYLSSNNVTTITLSSTNKVGIGTTSPGSTLQINGSFQGNMSYTASNILLNDTHYIMVATASSITISLPDITTSMLGRVYIVKNMSGGSINVDPDASDRIDTGGLGVAVSIGSLGYIQLAAYASGYWIKIAG
jgi:hypothetical protein